jgi:hypothetical protein
MSVSAPRFGWRSAASLTVLMLLCLLCTACGATVTPDASYKPPFLPFEISVGASGDSTIEGSISWATEIGEFSIGAQFELPPRRPESIFVILRNRNTGYDKVYEVQTDGEQFNAVVNGTTNITVTNDQVLIDVTNGNIRSVRFKQVTSPLHEDQATGWIPRAGHWTEARWDAGWSDSPYKPLDLTKLAYDDSTLMKWYGLGFVLFLLRLISAILLFFVDIVLIVIFLVSQLAFILFGLTGRNVFYGLFALLVIIMIAIQVYRISYRIRHGFWP